MKRLHAGQGNPPSRGTLPGGLSFCHVNAGSSRVTRLVEVRGPRYIPRQLLMLTASGDYAQLVECKMIALDTEKRPLAERVIKKKNLPPIHFFCLLSAILFVRQMQTQHTGLRSSIESSYSTTGIMWVAVMSLVKPCRTVRQWSVGLCYWNRCRSTRGMKSNRIVI